MSNIQDYLDGLVPQRAKKASPDLSHLSLSDLEELMGIESAEKLAYGMCGPYDGDGWLRQFMGSPLYEKAIALMERELTAEQKAADTRDRRQREVKAEESIWREQDKIRFDKNRLVLELHKRLLKMPKAKIAEEIMYTGGVGNGDPKHPGWPRAALGVDSANRPATPEEKREQSKTVAPDIAHTTPKQTGAPFVDVSHHDGRHLVKKIAEQVKRASGHFTQQEFDEMRSSLVRLRDEKKARAQKGGFGGWVAGRAVSALDGDIKSLDDSRAKMIKKANLAATAARGLAHAPPIPAAARAVRPAGGMFAPAAGPSPFMGLGAAQKLGPARPLSAGSMQTSQFLARQPGGAGMLEAVGAVNEISRMPGKAQSLALGKRMGIGSDVAAHRAHLANTQGMTHLASLDLSRFFAKLAGTLDPAVTARARAYMSQIAQRHAIVRDAIPDMAATGARLRAAAAAKEQVHAPVVAAVKSFPRPAGVTPPSIPSAPMSPHRSGTTLPSTRLGTTVPNSTAPIPGSGRRRPAWAAPPSMGEAPAASVAKTMVARPR